MLLPKPKKFQKRLKERFTLIELKKSHGYEFEDWEDWEEIGRCYYYLRDERATEYLRQAAALLVQKQLRDTINPHSSSSLFGNAIFWFYAANLYRLIGDVEPMTQCLIQLRSFEAYATWHESLSPVEFYWDLLALAALMDGDAVQALHYDAKIAALPKRESPERPWSGRLADAIVQADAQAIRAIGIELHTLLIRSHGKPWDTSYLNPWDWYELSEQLADRLEAQQ